MRNGFCKVTLGQQNPSTNQECFWIGRISGISDGMALGGPSADEELGLFHPEDIAISKAASHSLTYRFPPPPDASDSFEAPLFGRIALVPAEKMDSLLQQIEADLSAPMPQ